MMATERPHDRHLVEEELLALADGELGPVEAVAARRHVDACGECTRELDRVRSLSASVSERLRLLDVEPRRPSTRALRWRARRRAVRDLPLPLAAVLALLLIAGAVAALPGSPVRAWIAEVLDGQARPAESAAAGAARAQSGEAAGPAATIAVPAESLDVRLEGEGPLDVAVVLSGSRRLEVRSLRGEQVSFEVGASTVTVRAGGAEAIRISLPRLPGRVRLLRGGTTLLERRGNELRMSVPAERRDSVVRLRVGGEGPADDAPAARPGGGGADDRAAGSGAASTAPD